MEMAMSGDQTQRFWDGFQWIVRTNDQVKAAHQGVSDINQSAVEAAASAVTGEDAATKEKRIAASKTVIIEGVALDLGITARELQKYILDELRKANGTTDVEIADIDMNNGPTSVAVELADRTMVETLKRLDGKLSMLGETLHIRRLNEETVHTNIQSAAIALAAMQEMIGKGEGQLNMKMGSLKTVAPSCVVKVSNVFEREEELTAELYEELKEDMEEEFGKIPHLKRIKIIRNGEERLGAEVGCVFVEFRDKRSAECALKKMKGRIYDGREIQVTYIDEKLYYKELCIE
ncbi:hypothetical protein FGO68_gene15484 [Halteria grandinella]|uniref:RRM domain-containing protein n=1 Tax=Halteria grandinella TaxID=5974 RepID=A0A8J8T398_HALGN|nr:hypothetical protein FGO68_gene15484 [Halteria grandinella]